MAARGARAAARADAAHRRAHAPSRETIRNSQPASRRSCRSWQQLGWTDGRNVRIDTAGRGEPIADSQAAAELVALAPDVI